MGHTIYTGAYYKGLFPSNGGFSGWKQLANAESLTWYTLPLRTGYSGNTSNLPRYAKDQFGNIYLRGYLLGSGNLAVSANALFADLPAGFRPLQTIHVPVSVAVTDGSITYCNAVSLEISSGGWLLLSLPEYISNFAGGGVSLEGILFQAYS